MISNFNNFISINENLELGDEVEIISAYDGLDRLLRGKTGTILDSEEDWYLVKLDEEFKSHTESLIDENKYDYVGEIIKLINRNQNIDVSYYFFKERQLKFINRENIGDMEEWED